MNSRSRSGELISTYDGQGKIIQFLYRNPVGQQLIKLLICPCISKAAGRLLSTRLSAVLVRRFVRRNRLDMSDYPKRTYRSFNDFFTRQIRPERRPIDRAPEHLIAPCDGKLTAALITEEAHVTIKGVTYTLEGLLQDRELAARYRGGWLLLFRLSVDDYHRYCYVADGYQSDEIRIPGVFHTVSPHAAGRRAIYRENTREYALLETAEFGTILQMEVGALLVGKINNFHEQESVRRGQEKGMFQFGGSTVVLLLERGRLVPDADIRRNSAAGEETVVKMGEKIGDAISAKPHGTSL